tara:strand:+ start:7851 stop:9518 length:1668 start_codon:yes stop_codon:yes gene_type:complete
MLNQNLRPWQKNAISKCLNWFKKHNRFLINAAPGAGKTICASSIAKILIDKAVIDRVIVIAPRREIVKQWAEEFKTITGRSMMKITNSSAEIEDLGIDLCATWNSVQNLLDVFKSVCNVNRTLVICDEHHHAAVEAVWGDSAMGAFNDAKYSIVLTGTPIRSDGKETTWFGFDSEGLIQHPQDGTYNLTYGQSVDLNYCRPITFHKHQGKFTVKIDNNEQIQISDDDICGDSKLKQLDGIKKALDYYKLCCNPKYKNDKPDIDGYQASMIRAGLEKLERIQDIMPEAGGLVIAPNIYVAEYMSKLLHEITKEKPFLVHSGMPNADDLISAFKTSKKDWIVSVNMVSEGVDIKRLRVLLYLPNAQTELSFRQAMGRIVRTSGKNDLSRAYVVMPTHKIFEEYAKRIEYEMKPQYRKDNLEKSYKICAVCEEKNDKKAEECKFCESPFPKKITNFKECSSCNNLNTVNTSSCIHCGERFDDLFGYSLEEALGHRNGVIAHGMDITEDEAKYSESIAKSMTQDLYSSGNEYLIRLWNKLPEEAAVKLVQISAKYKKIN